MVTFFVAVFVSVFCGIGLGAVVARSVVKKRIYRQLLLSSVRQSFMRHSAAFVSDDHIARAAEQYAEAHRYPGVAPLVAQHLRAWRSADQARLRRTEKTKFGRWGRRWGR